MAPRNQGKAKTGEVGGRAYRGREAEKHRFVLKVEMRPPAGKLALSAKHFLAEKRRNWNLKKNLRKNKTEGRRKGKRGGEEERQSKFLKGAGKGKKKQPLAGFFHSASCKKKNSKRTELNQKKLKETHCRIRDLRVVNKRKRDGSP